MLLIRTSIHEDFEEVIHNLQVFNAFYQSTQNSLQFKVMASIPYGWTENEEGMEKAVENK